MSPAPRELRENGFLLNDLEYISEAEAAIALNVTTQSLITYRKAGSGPPFSTVGRTVFYSKENLRKWLEAGGTRVAVERGVAKESA